MIFIKFVIFIGEVKMSSNKHYLKNTKIKFLIQMYLPTHSLIFEKNIFNIYFRGGHTVYRDRPVDRR